jgi:hypothetical protein
VLLNEKHIGGIIHCFVHCATPEGRKVQMPSFDEHCAPSSDNMLQRLIFHATRGECSAGGLFSGVCSANVVVKPLLDFDETDRTLGGNIEFIYDLNLQKLIGSKQWCYDLMKMGEDCQKIT